jgi:SAM-dependent methyltransferase
VGDFSVGWLTLREATDHAARSLPLTRAVADAIQLDGELRVLDLGAGTGSNLRYLAARLSKPQRWLLVDRDATLLARAARARVPHAQTIETRQLDLGGIADEWTRALFDRQDLVTASALLDLVSERWLLTLAARCREAGAAALFALSYDGRIECAPDDEDDESVRRLVNVHQRHDKGFGPALGPTATECAERVFTALGYRVQRDRSDWTLQADAPELQRELIDGWARAAIEVAPAQSASIDAWRVRRLAHVTSGRSELRVGHEDLGAWIPTRNRRARGVRRKK